MDQISRHPLPIDKRYQRKIDSMGAKENGNNLSDRSTRLLALEVTIDSHSIDSAIKNSTSMTSGICGLRLGRAILKTVGQPRERDAI